MQKKSKTQEDRFTSKMQEVAKLLQFKLGIHPIGRGIILTSDPGMGMIFVGEPKEQDNKYDQRTITLWWKKESEKDTFFTACFCDKSEDWFVVDDRKPKRISCKSVHMNEVLDAIVDYIVNNRIAMGVFYYPKQINRK